MAPEEQQINRLRNMLTKAGQLYYYGRTQPDEEGGQQSWLSDSEYDGLERWLRDLEEKHPEYADPKSPTHGPAWYLPGEQKVWPEA